MPTVQFGVHVIEHVATDPAVAWHLDWHFGRLPPGRGPTDLHVRLGQMSIDVPQGREPMIDGPLERWLDHDRVWLRHESGVTGRAGASSIEIDSSRLDRDDWRPSRQLLFSALSWWLEARGVALLHGGLVGSETEAMLVLGGTGTGKSTIVAAALAHGWQVFADDLVAVRLAGAGLEVTGLPKRMMVAPELVDEVGGQLDDSLGEAMPGDARGRLVLPPAALTTGSRRLRGVVVAGHDDGVGRLEALAHRDVLQAVMWSSLETGRATALRRQLGLLSAVAGLASHRLAHARSAEGRVATAARLLAAAWEASPTTADPDAAAAQ